mmetsp:Transcript_59697/g.185147  ORF Transcript_59697/g.185147 Transcript_59697/m.185147 type:complete len:261 (+) Transcript_59697:344-1126(+)
MGKAKGRGGHEEGAGERLALGLSLRPLRPRVGLQVREGRRRVPHPRPPAVPPDPAADLHARRLHGAERRHAAAAGKPPAPQAARRREGCEGRLCESARNAVGKAGDLIIYVGFMWHSSGVNLHHDERAAVIVQCLPYFFKPMHSHAYRLPNSVAQSLSPKMRNRLGLTGYTWFKHTGQLGNGEPQPLRHGFLMLWDALVYGYPVRRKDEPLYGREYALYCLAAPLLCLLRRRLLETLKLLLAVSVGLLLGVTLLLEKFQM